MRNKISKLLITYLRSKSVNYEESLSRMFSLDQQAQNVRIIVDITLWEAVSVNNIESDLD